MRTALHTLLFVLLFATSLLAVGRLTSAVVPWPEEYGLQAKFEYLAAHKDEFDAVFIGSSRMFRGVDPTVFDAELAERGIAVRSFNLAVGGMDAFEQDYVLHRVLALESERLRWIFIEGGRWDPRFGYSFNVFSTRSVFWHAPRQTAHALASVARLDAPLAEKLALARDHTRLMARKASAYGEGRRILARMKGPIPDPRDRELGPEQLTARQGYVSREEQTGRDYGEFYGKLFEDSTVYDERMREIVAAEGTPIDLRRTNLRALEGQLRATAARGVELIYVVLPGYDPAIERPYLHQAGHIPTLFHYNRPDEYPELTRLENRYDVRHLNRRGAAILSRILANDFAEHLGG